MTLDDCFGRLVIVIRQNDLVQSIADSLQFISYYHPPDFITAMTQAWEKETAPAAKDALQQVLVNSRMCYLGKRPICQDTGIVIVFVEVGMDVTWQTDSSLEDMINEGVRRAYLNSDNPLRGSILSDPDGLRKNTKTILRQSFTRRSFREIKSVLISLLKVEVANIKRDSRFWSLLLP